MLRCLWMKSVTLLLLAAGAAGAAEPSARDAQQLAGKIDQHLGRRWTVARVAPAAPADDAEFLRRVSLDLAGRIPSVEETRTFLESKQPDKRARLVEQLLAGPRYPIHFANVFRALFLPEADSNFLVQAQQGLFQTWLKQELAGNVGYDRLVRDLLTVRIVGGNNGLAALTGYAEPGPTAFYFAKEFKPENLAAGTARVFLGISVECAQCHNHPFADWKRDQFWSLSAFYAGIKSQRLMDFLLPAGEDAGKHELTIPGTDKVVQAAFLDGTKPSWKAGAGSRETLAAWVTAKDNPYFARATVNRLWAHFFGTGLVEPLGEMVGANSASSHPELLTLLAQEFTEHDFDLKFLIRAVTNARAYQLTSARTTAKTGTGPLNSKGPVPVFASADDPRLFARMPLRGLTGEQLFDSVAMATGYRDAPGTDNLLASLLGGNRSARAEFLIRFNSSERPTESQTSILHALALMNGKVTADATTLERSETLAAIVDVPLLSTAQRIETLYLATLARVPEPKEAERTVSFVQAAVHNAKENGASARSAKDNALADVFWALLNSPEFILNH